ncbi:MAG: single-stranded DNA-binding protein [Peptoniphilus harei]|nr:single-stranded DNA-binding protein [Peptoniphilus harei]
MNLVILSGNLCQEWEERSTISGKIVVSNTIAVRDGKEKSQFIKIKAWESTAQLLTKYIKKGDKFTLQGLFKTDTYEKEGKKNYFNYILIQNFEFGYKPGVK